MMGLLSELLKDSKRSDRELAKVLGVSQPTVARMKQKLVKEGVIREFTVIPDFAKMGYEIMAITVGKMPKTQESVEKGRKEIRKYPNIIFASRAHGMGKDAVMISLHKSYSDYSNFYHNLRLELGDQMDGSDSLIITLKGFLLRPLSLKYLAEQEETY